MSQPTDSQPDARASSEALAQKLLSPPLSVVTPPADWDEFRKALRPVRRALRAVVAEYRHLEWRLRAEGFRVRLTCPITPVQLEGRLPSGERFYFRCRGDTCALHIAPRRGDPVSQPTWSQVVSRWDEHEASSLTAEEVEPVLRELLAAYAARRP